MTEESLQRITVAYDEYKTIDRFTCLAPKEEIKENDFNLNKPRYVDTFEEEKPVDMDAVKQNITQIESELTVVKEKMNHYLAELGL